MTDFQFAWRVAVLSVLIVGYLYAAWHWRRWTTRANTALCRWVAKHMGVEYD